MSASPQFISTAQAAERLGLSREHVRRLIQRGELRAEETVNGFMLDVNEVERQVIQRQLLQDQRQFRSAMDDLAAQSRRVSGTTSIQGAVAEMRDKMKHHAAFEVPAAIAPQMELIAQEVEAQKALATLAGPVATVAEQWRRYSEGARRVAENITSAQAGLEAATNVAMLQRQEGRFVPLMRKDDPLATASPVAPRPSELARGFVVAESREGRWGEKMDALGRKVEQLTELVMQQRADTATAMPTWQQWAGSDRPEDVLAKLAAIREAIAGGKQSGENSTDVIRASREARGRSE